jgi:hypothetical protein
MRLSIFVLLFAVLILIIAALVPSSVALATLNGVPTASFNTPQCLAIGYCAGFDTAYMPHTLRLDPDTIAARDRAETRHGASGDAALGWREDAWWQNAGADSIDVSAHHSALFRIPRGTDVRVGRVQPYWSGTVLMGWLTSVPTASPVTVRNIPCTDLRGPA